MKERTYTALGLTDHSLFEELLTKEEGKYTKELISCLNSPMEGKYSPAMIFYPLEHEVEIEVEELEGKQADYDICTGYNLCSHECTATQLCAAVHKASFLHMIQYECVHVHFDSQINKQYCHDVNIYSENSKVNCRWGEQIFYLTLCAVYVHRGANRAVG